MKFQLISAALLFEGKISCFLINQLKLNDPSNFVVFTLRPNNMKFCLCLKSQELFKESIGVNFDKMILSLSKA